MKTCETLVDFCMEYLEGTLPEGDRQGFEMHLEGCPGCVAFFETYRRTPEVSRVAVEAQMPESVRQSVRAFLRAKIGGEPCGDHPPAMGVSPPERPR